MEQWNDNRRVDGLAVVEGVDGWIIMPKKGLPVAACPCCSKNFPTDRSARITADNLFACDTPQ